MISVPYGLSVRRLDAVGVTDRSVQCGVCAIGSGSLAFVKRGAPIPARRFRDMPPGKRRVRSVNNRGTDG